MAIANIQPGFILAEPCSTAGNGIRVQRLKVFIGCVAQMINFAANVSTIENCAFPPQNTFMNNNLCARLIKSLDALKCNSPPPLSKCILNRKTKSYFAYPGPAAVSFCLQ